MVGGGEPLVFKLNKLSRRVLESSTLALGCSAEQTASQLIQGSQPEPTLLLQSSIQRGTDRQAFHLEKTWSGRLWQSSQPALISNAPHWDHFPTTPKSIWSTQVQGQTETARCTSCPRGKHTGKAKLQQSRLLWWREGQSATEAQQEDQWP